MSAAPVRAAVRSEAPPPNTPPPSGPPSGPTHPAPTGPGRAITDTKPGPRPLPNPGPPPAPTTGEDWKPTPPPPPPPPNPPLPPRGVTPAGRRLAEIRTAIQLGEDSVQSTPAILGAVKRLLDAPGGEPARGRVAVSRDSLPGGSSPQVPRPAGPDQPHRAADPSTGLISTRSTTVGEVAASEGVGAASPTRPQTCALCCGPVEYVGYWRHTGIPAVYTHTATPAHTP